MRKYETYIYYKANLSEEAIDALISGLETGVYYGWAQIGQVGTQVYPMVMSLGWNPYYQNDKRSAVNNRGRGRKLNIDNNMSL